MNTRRLSEAGTVIFKGYGFIERMTRKFEKIQSIETSNIMEKTIYHLNNANIEKVVLLPVNLKENQEEAFKKAVEKGFKGIT